MELSALQDLAAEARWVVLVLFLALTAWTDTRYERIRNVHTFPTMLLGLVLGLVSGGVDGLILGLLGILAGFLPSFPLFALGILKAGDAKMLMAIGALTGPGLVLRALLASFFVFLPVAIVLLLLRGKLGNVGQALHRLWRYFYTTFHPLLEREPLSMEGATYTPHAVVLGVSTLLVWQTSFLDLGLDLF